MSEFTKEYFDKHYEELNEFLSKQFTKMGEKSDKLASDMQKGFAQQAIQIGFIQSDIEEVKADLKALSKRTKEDDQMFSKEIMKLKNRVEVLERKLKAFKAQHT